MLPARSKRYAGVNGEIPRLTLAANWQLALIGLLTLALLASIFPRKALVEKLYQLQTLDELTLSYIQNLYRADTGNADVALLLARSQRDTLDLQALESIVLRSSTEGDLRQRTEARSMLFEAYGKALAKPLRAAEKSQVTARLIALMQNARSDELPEQLASAFSAKAFALDLPKLGLVFFEKWHVGKPELLLEKYGDLALGEGRYEAAANYFFLAQDSNTALDEKRRLFQKGINTLMADSLFAQALQAAALHTTALESDPATLRFLAHTALAAGNASLAAQYARKLVFRAPQDALQ